jgi:hypothetical protein
MCGKTARCYRDHDVGASHFSGVCVDVWRWQRRACCRGVKTSALGGGVEAHREVAADGACVGDGDVVAAGE